MKGKEKKNKKIKGNEGKYSCADQMLITIRHEYEVENLRKQILDTKASTFITVNIALLTIFIPLIPFSNIQEFFINAGIIERVISVIALVCLCISIIILMVSFVVLVYVAGISGYSRVNLDSLKNLSENTENIDESCVKKGLVEHYYQILRGTIDVKGNYVINTDRADKIQVGITLTVIGYVGIFVSTIVLRVIVV